MNSLATAEKTVKVALKRYLTEIGAYYFMPVQMGMGAACVDFLVCHKGRFYGIETKRGEVHEVTPRQKLIMSQIEAAGGSCWMENSTKLEMTRALLG